MRYTINGDIRNYLGNDLSACGGVVAARGGLVDIVLENRIGHGADGAESEAERHLANRTPLDSSSAEERVKHMVDNGSDDHNGDRVEIVEKIVRDTVRLHASCKSIGGSTEGTIVDEEDGEEAEYSRSLEGAAHIVDEVIVVTVLLGATSGSPYTGLGGVPEALAADGADAAIAESISKDLEDIAEVRSSRGLFDQAGVEVPQQGREHEVDNGGDEVGGPVANQSGEVGGGNTKGGTNIDQQVEPQHDAVDGVLGVNNDPLAVGVGDDVRNLVRALVHDSGRDIGLELGYARELVSKSR